MTSPAPAAFLFTALFTPMITVLHHKEPNDPKDDREPLNIHGPAKNSINYGSINRFQEFRAIQLPPRTAISFGSANLQAV